MDTTQHRSKRLCQSSYTQPTAFKQSPLLDLPMELLLETASYLPVESVACLALTCKGLYSCLEKEYIQPLKDADDVVLKTFLQLLQRDLTEYIACPTCVTLHSTALAERYVVEKSNQHPSSQVWSKCRITDSKAQRDRTMPPRFSSTIFLMAMKAYRQGQDTSSLLNLLSHKEIVAKSGYAQLTTSEARICYDTLLVRDQIVFMLPSPRFTPASLSGTFGFCRHSTLDMLDRESDLEWIGITVPDAGEIGQYQNKEGHKSCGWCLTELQIDFKSCGKDYNAMFVTRWMDVGKGCDEKDPKWRGRWDHVWAGSGWGPPSIVYKLGSLSALFEGTYDFQFDSLLTKEDEIDLRAKCPLEGAGEGNGPSRAVRRPGVSRFALE